MKAFEIETKKSDYPYLVIAGGFGEAVEMMHMKGVYDTDIISVRQLEAYRDSYILHEGELKTREDIKDEVRQELQKAMPRWMPEPDGIAGGGDRDLYLIRTAKGYYFTSSVLGGSSSDYFLNLDSLEQLPGLPKED